MSLKLTIVCGWIAFAATFWPIKGSFVAIRRPIVLYMGLVLVAYLAVRGIFTEHPRDALIEVATTFSGKIVLFWALIRAVRSKSDLVVALNWFIRGGVVAALFGIYQLVAFYVGIPQFITYTGTGGDGGMGRIASFSYEPAYFGYFLLLVLGALVARSRLTHKPFSPLILGLLLVTILLVNSRGVYFILPVLLVALQIWDKELMTRKARISLAASIAALVLLSLVFFQSAWRSILHWISTAFDPSETSSNAVRLGLFDNAGDTIASSPIFGVGPGQFYHEAVKLGLDAGGDNASLATANNIFLQSMLDGGVILTLLQLVFIGSIVFFFVVRGSTPVRSLALTYLIVLIMAGFVISNFYESKMWLVLGLVTALARFAPKSSKEVQGAE